MKMTLVAALLCSVALIVGACDSKGSDGAAPSTRATTSADVVSDLPPTRVMLYQNGIGYIERTGKLQGTSLRLRVRPEQVNDILKSLVVIDRASGQALAISLPIQKSADRMTRELPKAIQDQGGIIALMATFRGAQVSVSTGGKSVKGRIAGVEKQERHDKHGQAQAIWQLTVLTKNSKLVPIDFAKIKGVTMHDKVLDVGLRQALDISLDAGSWKPIELTVRLSPGDHDLLVSYIIEMPVWKPTYRLVAEAGGDSVLMQGWAKVDNVSGEDWNDVSLSLVAGEPLSFTYDLHTPLFRQRPHLAVRTQATQHIPTASVAAAPKMKKRAKRSRSRAPAAAAKMAADLFDDEEEESGAFGTLGSGAAESDVAISMDSLRSSVQTMVSGTEVGALFKYDIENKITVPDRSASLVSVLTKEIPGNDVHLFRLGSWGYTSNAKPYRAMRFENKSGFALEEGPIALYRGNTFVGEGMLGRVGNDDTVFVPYAIDNQVTLWATEDSSEEAVGIVKIVDGVITSEMRRVSKVTYTIENNRDDGVKAWIRRDKRNGWTLKGHKAALELGAWRYIPMDVPAKQKYEMEVIETEPVRRTVRISSNVADELIAIYLGSDKAQENIKGPLKEVLEIKAKLNEMAKDMRALQKEKDLLSEDQRRIQADIDALKDYKGNQSTIRQYSKELTENGKRLSKVSLKMVEQGREGRELEKKMTNLFSKIELKDD